MICELAVHTRIDAPAYVTVSYTWGSEEDLECLSVNGLSMLVRRNCFNALWQLRLHNVKLLIWIDSICINQDDKDEKSNQVRLMGLLYANAQFTVACIGSSLCLQAIVQLIEVQDSDVSSALPKSRHWSEARTALLLLTQNNYFKRLWIVQELYHSRSIVILCGEDHLLWQELELFFFEVVQNSAYLVDESIIESEFGIGHTKVGSMQLGASLDSTELARLIHFRKFRQAQFALKTEWTDELTGHGFTGVLLSFGRGECAEPRDKIYGLLSLAQDRRWLIDFPVDYNRPLVQVLCDVVIRIGNESLTENTSRLVANMLEWFKIDSTVFRADYILRSPNPGGPSIPWNNFATDTIAFESTRVWRLYNVSMTTNKVIPSAEHIKTFSIRGTIEADESVDSMIWHQVCMARGRVITSQGGEFWIAGPDLKPGDFMVEFDGLRDDVDDYRTVLVCRRRKVTSQRLEVVNQTTGLFNLEAYYGQRRVQEEKAFRSTDRLPKYEMQYLRSTMLLARLCQERATIHLRPMDLLKLVLFRGRIVDRIEFPILSGQSKCYITLDERSTDEESRTITITVSWEEYEALSRELRQLVALKRYCFTLIDHHDTLQLSPAELNHSLEAIYAMDSEQRREKLLPLEEPLDAQMRQNLNRLIRLSGLRRRNTMLWLETSMREEISERRTRSSSRRTANVRFPG